MNELKEVSLETGTGKRTPAVDCTALRFILNNYELQITPNDDRTIEIKVRRNLGNVKHISGPRLICYETTDGVVVSVGM